MPKKNRNLINAQASKQDEFYTLLSDIEIELKHYKSHFKDKVVLCNCDDPYESNFFKYFALNFNHLGLKKLICISYEGSPFSGKQLNFFGTDKPAHVIEITEVKDFNNDGRTDISDVEWLLKNDKNSMRELKGNGDFRSEESIELLKEADIVVTNPPFSLFRDYIKQLLDYNKKFIIIGNQNAFTYKEIFPLLKDNIIWTGYNNGDMAFKVPDYYQPRKTRFWIDETGQKWRSMGNITWFTNLDIPKRHEDLILYKKFNINEYPNFKFYKAINVDKVSEIPKDYLEAMGVPITFINKYNPEQFEILNANDFRRKNNSKIKVHGLIKDKEALLDTEENRRAYVRVLIKRK